MSRIDEKEKEREREREDSFPSRFDQLPPPKVQKWQERRKYRESLNWNADSISRYELSRCEIIRAESSHETWVVRAKNSTIYRGGGVRPTAN
jgi:hypothetical protein